MPLPRAARVRVAVLGLLAVLVVAGVWWGALERLRLASNQALAVATQRNDNLALAHEERTVRALEVHDLLLRVVRDEHLRGVQRGALRERVAMLGTDARHVGALSLIGPDGRLLDSTLDGGAAENFADRDYFRHHRDAPADELLIGPPLRGRVSGRWGVTLTRRIALADGRFGGVVFMSVDPAFLSTLYTHSENGVQGSLAVIGLDGITRARRNGGSVTFGDDVRRSQLFAELPRARSGHYTARAASDGVLRTVSYRQLDAYPLVVVVASSVDEVLAQARQREQPVLWAAAAASLLVGVLAVLLGRRLQRRARSLAALQASERRHRLLFENSFDATLRARPDGTLVAANAMACALFGRDEAGLCVQGLHGLFDPEDPRRAALLPLPTAVGPGGRAQGAVRLRHADGRCFEAEVSVSVYVDGDGQEAVTMVARDLTERHAAEAERRQLEAQLREAQKLDSLGTLAGGIAHDFNNVLAAILGNVALARQDLADPAQAEHSLARIAQAASRARALVQQILTFSRRAPEQRQAQWLQPLLQEALALLRAAVPASVQLQVAVPATALAAAVDATQFQQVVLNLCNNAWQALPGHQGWVRMTLDTVAPDDCPRHHAEGWVRLCVADNGTGMDEATRARLFEPFFTTKPVGEGTGLGLAVVHGIVAAHGGSITVRSRPGEGSEFEVLLPRAAAASVAPSRAEAPAPPSRGRGQRLVYVDDDEVLSLTVCALLQRAGYAVTRHSGAASALQALHADPASFELLVTDFHMPGMSGLALARAARSLVPGLPVIISTGHISDGLQAQALEAGVFRVMRKEYTLEQLAPLVEEAMATARQPAPA